MLNYKRGDLLEHSDTSLYVALYDDGPTAQEMGVIWEISPKFRHKEKMVFTHSYREQNLRIVGHVEGMDAV